MLAQLGFGHKNYLSRSRVRKLSSKQKNKRRLEAVTEMKKYMCMALSQYLQTLTEFL